MDINSVFKNNERIPEKYTCKGEDISPPFTILEIPNGTKSLTLIIDDPDAPAKTWVHWVVFNIPTTNEIKENSIPGTQGINDFNKIEYGGPCPPSGIHHYYFKLYALDTILDLQEGCTKEQVEQAMQGHILEQAELIGLASK